MNELRFRRLLLLLLAIHAMNGCSPRPRTATRVRRPASVEETSPRITRVLRDGQEAWSEAAPAKLTVHPGEDLTIEGEGFGPAPDRSLSRALFGTARALERDLPIYTGSFSVRRALRGASPYLEQDPPAASWPKDIRSWSDQRIELRVPVAASRGPLVVQTQRWEAEVPAAPAPDPLTERLPDGDRLALASVHQAGAPRASNPVELEVVNDGFAGQVGRGEAIFWAFDFNLGLVQDLLGAKWRKIFAGQAVDPVTGQPADPGKLFGAIPLRAGEVPEVATKPFRFDPYPMPMFIHGLLDGTATSGTTTPSGWVGYVAADSINPLGLPGAKPAPRIGFGCASCHARRITYEDAPGHFVAKVFPGLPNVDWTMKFTVLGPLLGVKGPEGEGLVPAIVDKTQLLYGMYPGTADASLVRSSVLQKRDFYRNDFLYSPTAIPIITRHTPLRRALSRSETIAGFEGSYLHAEEPDGAFGSLQLGPIQDLTAYMTTLDRDDELLTRVGMFEWLKFKGRLAELGGAGEPELIHSPSLAAFPALAARVEAGRQVFARDCASCHAPNFGTNTDENMIPLARVGSYFSPTAWQRQQGAIRTAMIRDLFWVQGRGLLHDGSIRSADPGHLDSAALLVDPERCREGSPLYNELYTLGGHPFRIPKGTFPQQLATRQQHYFTDLPGANAEQRGYLYWDYQSMRRQFGPRELGTSAPTPLPAAPHPWCAATREDADALVYYLFTI